MPATGQRQTSRVRPIESASTRSATRALTRTHRQIMLAQALLRRSAVSARRSALGVRRASTEQKSTELNDPTTRKEWWLAFAKRQKQGIFNVGVSFAVCVLASQSLESKQARRDLEAQLDLARGELHDVRARVTHRSPAFPLPTNRCRPVSVANIYPPPPIAGDGRGRGRGGRRPRRLRRRQAPARARARAGPVVRCVGERAAAVHRIRSPLIHASPHRPPGASPVSTGQVLVQTESNASEASEHGALMPARIEPLGA